MSTPTSGDLLLVNRGGVNYQIDYDDMSTLQDTDLLLVNRAGVNYQIAASDVNLGPDGLILPSVDVLTPVNGAGLNDGDTYTPLSSAYVSTDTTPIYNRYFPQTITTISGGTWVDENNIFDASSSTYATLSGAAYVVSQAVFTNISSLSLSGEAEVFAYCTSGGTIEVIDENDAVLRSYPLPGSAGSTAIGIVRVNNKIRYTSDSVNQNLYIGMIKIGGSRKQDSIISGRVAFEFTDDTDLDKMVAPIIMTDENGNLKVPTTSTVDSTTTIPGENKDLSRSYYGNNTPRTFDQNGGETDKPPIGARMVWGKRDNSGSGFISDNVSLFGNYLLTSQAGALKADFGPELHETYSRYPAGNAYSNINGSTNYIHEIGVAPKVLDIVTWTGNSSNIREIPHNLGTKPGMIIIKSINRTYHSDWSVWHTDISSGFLQLNTTYIPNNGYSAFESEPTKDAFYIGSSERVNGNDDNYVAYVFAADTPGKVKCGTYEGIGYTQVVQTPDIHAGFVLIKNLDSTQNWIAVTQETSSVDKYWGPNNASQMYGDNTDRVALQDGMLIMEDVNAEYNYNGHQYIYLAIDRDLVGPNSTQLNLLSGQDLEYFTTGTEITSNLAASGSNISFSSETWDGNGNAGRNIYPQVNNQDGNIEYFFNISDQVNDKWWLWIKSYDSYNGHNLYDSERGYNAYLKSSTNQTSSPGNYDTMIIGPTSGGAPGYRIGNSGFTNENNASYISWNFLAAPQFFDVQKYIGNGIAGHTIQHDLGVEPGCIIIKSLKTTDDWFVWHTESDDPFFSDTPNSRYLYLNDPMTGGNRTDWCVPDANSMALSYHSETNAANQDFISYFFAKDTPYVKCGKYTGAGAGTSVNVGFKPRWMLIKRTDTARDWIIIDKELPGEFVYANKDDTGLSLDFSFNATGVVFTAEWTGVSQLYGSFIYIAIADETEGHPPSFPSSTTVTETPDPATATMVVNAESFDVGDSASAPALNASITSVAGAEGNSLLVDASTGTWLPGLYAKGSETTVTAPSAGDITFTSTNAGTTPFSGVDATLSSRTWTLESSTTATGPWTVVDTYVDYDALASQDGATPWSSNKPALTADTFYRVKVQYDSTNAESVESVYSTFKTSA